MANLATLFGNTPTGWGIWAIRSVITLAATTGVVYYLSFDVADYVVKASITGVQETVRQQGDRDQQNFLSMQEDRRRTDDVLRDLTSSGAELKGVLKGFDAQQSGIRSDLAAIKDAVSKPALPPLLPGAIVLSPIGQQKGAPVEFVSAPTYKDAVDIQKDNPNLGVVIMDTNPMHLQGTISPN